MRLLVFGVQLALNMLYMSRHKDVLDADDMLRLLSLQLFMCRQRQRFMVRRSSPIDQFPEALMHSAADRRANAHGNLRRRRVFDCGIVWRSVFG